MDDEMNYEKIIRRSGHHFRIALSTQPKSELR